MAKMIQVISTRMCCQLEDLIDSISPGDPTAKGLSSVKSLYPTRMWCKYCGTEHEYYRFTDAAGSGDWNYRPVDKSKKQVHDGPNGTPSRRGKR